MEIVFAARHTKFKGAPLIGLRRLSCEFDRRAGERRIRLRIACITANDLGVEEKINRPRDNESEEKQEREEKSPARKSAFAYAFGHGTGL